MTRRRGGSPSGRRSKSCNGGQGADRVARPCRRRLATYGRPWCRPTARKLTCLPRGELQRACDQDHTPTAIGTARASAALHLYGASAAPTGKLSFRTRSTRSTPLHQSGQRTEARLVCVGERLPVSPQHRDKHGSIIATIITTHIPMKQAPRRASSVRACASIPWTSSTRRHRHLAIADIDATRRSSPPRCGQEQCRDARKAYWKLARRARVVSSHPCRLLRRQSSIGSAELLGAVQRCRFQVVRTSGLQARPWAVGVHRYG